VRGREGRLVEGEGRLVEGGGRGRLVEEEGGKGRGKRTLEGWG